MGSVIEVDEEGPGQWRGKLKFFGSDSTVEVRTVGTFPTPEFAASHIQAWEERKKRVDGKRDEPENILGRFDRVMAERKKTYKWAFQIRGSGRDMEYRAVVVVARNSNSSDLPGRYSTLAPEWFKTKEEAKAFAAKTLIYIIE